MKSFSVRIPADERDRLDDLVADSDYFEDRSQAIRYAIRAMLQVEGDLPGFRVQTSAVERHHANQIADKCREAVGARNIEWAVVPAVEGDGE